MKRLLLLLPLLLAADAREVAARDGANLQRPRWSPDAAKLSYEANFHDKKVVELYTGSMSGPFTRVTPSARGGSSITAGFSTSAATAGVAHELSWSPAAIGRYVYSGTTDAQDYDLFLSGGGALAAHPAADGGPAWSPDGRYIAFTSSRSGQGDVYVLDVGAIEKPPVQVSRDPGSSELWLDWSADARLVWVGHGTGGDNLWLGGVGAEPARLTTWPGIQTRPRWSPAGDAIAFYANREVQERFDLYAVAPKPGAEPRLVVKGVVPNATGPTWTPDGRHLVAVLDDDARYDPIVAVPSAGGAPVTLALGTVGHGDLDVARAGDGRLWLAYVAQGRTDDTERSFKRLFVAELGL